MKINLNIAIGISILLVQVFFMVKARFHDARYFCWAPHDSQNIYWLDVTINNNKLSDSDIKERYHLDSWGYWNGVDFETVMRDPRAIAHVQDIIQQYESTYGKRDKSIIKMIYHTNGREKKTWEWSNISKHY